jgi:hypothetical protein
MNKQTIKNFLADPLVQDALKTDGEAEVGRMAMTIGNIEKNQDLREFGQILLSRNE